MSTKCNDQSGVMIKIKSVMSEVLKIDPADIPDNASISNYSQWDSLNHIHILLALEAEYGFDVNVDVIQKLVSIKEIVAYISQRN